MSQSSLNYWLISSGILSGIAALMHIAIIIGGPDWYRFLAGEGMARAAAQGRMMPTLITHGIAMMLAIWPPMRFRGPD